MKPIRSRFKWFFWKKMSLYGDGACKANEVMFRHIQAQRHVQLLLLPQLHSFPCSWGPTWQCCYNSSYSQTGSQESTLGDRSLAAWLTTSCQWACHVIRSCWWSWGWETELQVRTPQVASGKPSPLNCSHNHQNMYLHRRTAIGLMWREYTWSSTHLQKALCKKYCCVQQWLLASLEESRDPLQPWAPPLPTDPETTVLIYWPQLGLPKVWCLWLVGHLSLVLTSYKNWVVETMVEEILF